MTFKVGDLLSPNCMLNVSLSGDYGLRPYKSQQVVPEDTFCITNINSATQIVRLRCEKYTAEVNLIYSEISMFFKLKTKRNLPKLTLKDLVNE